jgi:membrane protein involved in colicin uptake
VLLLPSALRVVAAAVGVLAVLLVSYSRLALGVHYLSDVAGAWLLGAAWLVDNFYLVEEQERRKQEEQERIRLEQEAEKERIRKEKEAEEERLRLEKEAEEQRLRQERMEQEAEDRGVRKLTLHASALGRKAYIKSGYCETDVLMEKVL